MMPPVLQPGVRRARIFQEAARRLRDSLGMLEPEAAGVWRSAPTTGEKLEPAVVPFQAMWRAVAGLRGSDDLENSMMGSDIPKDPFHSGAGAG